LQRLLAGGLHDIVSVPLLAEGHIAGVLIAARHEASSFNGADRDFLRQLGDHVALAIHQAQLYADLQRSYEDLRQSQEVVLQQERLRALGEMASGIAHDINNAISPGSLYVQALLDHGEGLSATARQQLKVVGMSIDSVADTVSRLRAFSLPRDPRPEFAQVNLNTLIVQVVEVTHARWCDMPQERGIFIDVRTELENTLPAIAGFEGEIRDSLTNLIFNGVDAMPAGGTLTLTTRSTSRGVSVEVRDTGSGMDEATRRRCLEPFYTTKGEHGSGLGLAMVYGMVKRHQGEMEIESVLGTGTTIRLLLPVGEAADHLSDKPAGPAPHISALHILLIDDDESILGSLSHVLEADGHQVEVAKGGQDGIAAFAQAVAAGRSFDVVITDLGMPHVDGRKVAAELANLVPATPVILLTGWGHSFIAENEVPDHVYRVLSKPPKLAELRATLASLDERRS
jgi:signal transduction histidine kinase/CheY-like chemotaxis protein